MAASKGGLIPHNRLGGMSNSTGTQQFFIKRNETANFFQGDLCLLDANGEIQPSTAVTDVRTIGVFLGCQYVDNSGDIKFANNYQDQIDSDGIVAHILCDPFQVYRIRAANSDANTEIDRIDIGMNYDIEYNGGNATTGQSGMCFDTGTAGATTVAQLKLVGLAQSDGTDSPTTATASTQYGYGLVILMPSISLWTADTGI